MINSQFKSHEKDEDPILDVQCFRGNWDVNADFPKRAVGKVIFTCHCSRSGAHRDPSNTSTI